MRLAVLLFLAFAATAPGAGLAIQQAAIERFDDGPPVLADDAFLAGEIVHFSFFAGGVQRKNDAVSVSFEAQPKDPQGLLLVPQITGKEQTTLTPEDKDWRPKLRGSFVLPGILLPGVYTVSLRLVDVLSGATISAVLPFNVSGPRVAPTGTLSIQNLNFYRNETDELPLETAAFRIDEEIHVRFLITGFKHDEKGALRVSYGVALTDNAGRVLFQNPSAAQEESAAFYPQPYVPGTLSFSMKSGTPSGEYTFTVTAHDAIGNQQTQVQRTFRLE